MLLLCRVPNSIQRMTSRGTFDFLVVLMLRLTLSYVILHFWSAGRVAVFSLNSFAFLLSQVSPGRDL